MKSKLEQARKHHQAGRVGRARDLYRKILKREPKNPEALFQYGSLMYQNGQPEAARDIFEHATSMAPGLPVFHAALGEILRQLGQMKAAEKSLSAALTLNPGDKVTRTNLALCFMEQGELVKAHQAFAEALDIDPTFAPALRSLALVVQMMGDRGHSQDDMDRVIKTYDKAVAARPDNPEALANMALAFHGLGKFEAVIGVCERVLRLAPHHFAARNTLGSALLNLDRVDEAIAAFQKAIEGHDGIGDTHFNLATAFHRNQRYSEALAAYERAADLMANDPTVHLAIGNLCNSSANFERAAEAFARALELDGAVFEAHSGLGQALTRLGRTDEAKAAYARALEIDPDDAAAQFALEALGQEPVAAAPADYVSELFDKMAPGFDTELRDHLHYRTPELLREAVASVLADERPAWTVADLGCGTGLCGPLFRGLAARMIGTDLSSGMIERAKERGVYDELRIEALEDTLAGAGQAFDLVLAADVFVYIGDLDSVFGVCAKALREGGYFAFSTEDLTGGDFSINRAMRFAHSQDYITGLAGKHDFEVVVADKAEIRTEAEKPIVGGIYVLRLARDRR
ncbi:MAG: tetratricopeptide repeat protein [Sphingomonadales bacterium]